MRYFIYIISILLVTSCDTNKTAESDSLLIDKTTTDSIDTNVLTFSFQTNFKNQNISNKSDRQIDLLFNGVNNYFGGHQNNKVDFQTECLQCEPIQEYWGGLVFANKLLITTNQIKFYDFSITAADSINRIKVHTDNRERNNPKFKFTDGKGCIKYLGISCDDADFNEVHLTYPSGEIVIDSLINASFFEYDLNNNGQKEQYLFGTRTCSQEFVLLRIRKSNDTAKKKESRTANTRLAKKPKSL